MKRTSWETSNKRVKVISNPAGRTLVTSNRNYLITVDGSEIKGSGVRTLSEARESGEVYAKLMDSYGILL